MSRLEIARRRSQTGLRPARELDSVTEFDLKTAASIVKKYLKYITFYLICVHWSSLVKRQRMIDRPRHIIDNFTKLFSLVVRRHKPGVKVVSPIYFLILRSHVGFIKQDTQKRSNKNLKNVTRENSMTKIKFVSVT